MSRDRLEDGLGYRFTDATHLDGALIHRSHTAEHPDRSDNERLEFLGDAVLQLVVTHFLFENYPELKEGQLAKVRAACVNREELAVVARRIDLGEHIRLGVGELQSGGRDKDSILADTMEAVIAAVYLDGGLEEARRMILGLWSDLIIGKAADPGWRDFKTRLQERLAVDGKRPTYVVNGTGPDHARTFTAVVELDGRTLGEGAGRSKKEAEQAAARAALDGG